MKTLVMLNVSGIQHYYANMKGSAGVYVRIPKILTIMRFAPLIQESARDVWDMKGGLEPHRYIFPSDISRIEPSAAFQVVIM